VNRECYNLERRRIYVAAQMYHSSQNIIKSPYITKIYLQLNNTRFSLTTRLKDSITLILTHILIKLYYRTHYYSTQFLTRVLFNTVSNCHVIKVVFFFIYWFSSSAVVEPSVSSSGLVVPDLELQLDPMSASTWWLQLKCTSENLLLLWAMAMRLRRRMMDIVASFNLF
jgi:hypothetical protein